MNSQNRCKTVDSWFTLLLVVIFFACVCVLVCIVESLGSQKQAWELSMSHESTNFCSSETDCGERKNCPPEKEIGGTKKGSIGVSSALNTCKLTEHVHTQLCQS